MAGKAKGIVGHFGKLRGWFNNGWKGRSASGGCCRFSMGRPFFISVASGDGHPKYTAPTILTFPGADTV